MRKIMTALMAVAAVGMVTAGCSSKSEVQRQREDVAQARLDVAKAKQEQQSDIAQARTDEQKDLARVEQKTDENVRDAQQDLAKERKDLAEAEARDINERMDNGSQSATGGSGLIDSKTEEIKGTVQSTTDTSLTLLIPSQDNRLMRFTANDQVKVTRDSQPLTLQSLKAGDEVRAAYQVDANGLRVLRSLDLTKVSAQHPAMKP